MITDEEYDILNQALSENGWNLVDSSQGRDDDFVSLEKKKYIRFVGHCLAWFMFEGKSRRLYQLTKAGKDAMIEWEK